MTSHRARNKLGKCGRAGSYGLESATVIVSLRIGSRTSRRDWSWRLRDPSPFSPEITVPVFLDQVSNLTVESGENFHVRGGNVR